MYLALLLLAFILQASELIAGQPDEFAPADFQPPVEELLSPRRVIASGKFRLGADTGIFEPALGLQYGSHRLDQSGGFDLLFHKIDAHAGGRFNLLDNFYLSGTARMPLYSYSGTEVPSSGPPPASFFSRHDYGYLRSPARNLSWSGELGLRLGLGIDLNIFYDRETLQFQQGGRALSQQEEQVGTRFIFRFD